MATCSLHTKGATEELDAELVLETEGGATGVAGPTGLQAGPQSLLRALWGPGFQTHCRGFHFTRDPGQMCRGSGEGDADSILPSPLTRHFTSLR